MENIQSYKKPHPMSSSSHWYIFSLLGFQHFADIREQELELTRLMKPVSDTLLPTRDVDVVSWFNSSSRFEKEDLNHVAMFNDAWPNQELKCVNNKTGIWHSAVSLFTALTLNALGIQNVLNKLFNWLPGFSGSAPVSWIISTLWSVSVTLPP